MKPNTIVLELSEFDRLRDIEKSHNKMLEGGVSYETTDDYYRGRTTVKTYNKEEWLEFSEKDKQIILKRVDECATRRVKVLSEENDKLRSKSWFSF